MRGLSWGLRRPTDRCGPTPGGTASSVLAAAEAVFAEMGLKAQVEEVARRAGVGVGTVCRHFPTKQALIEAVLEAMYESLLTDAEHALQRARCRAPRSRRSSSPLAEFQARHRALAEQMATAIDLPASAQPTRDALRAAIGELVDARAGGGRDPCRHRPGRRRDAVLRRRAHDRDSRASSSRCSASAT